MPISQHDSYAKTWVILPPKSALIWILGFWLLGTAKLQAQTETSLVPTLLAHEHPSSEVSELFTQISDRENISYNPLNQTDSVTRLETFRADALKHTTSAAALNGEKMRQDDLGNLAPFLIAAPENLSPEQQLPPAPAPAPVKPPELPKPTESSSTESKPPFLALEDLKIDFRDDLDNFERHNRIIEPMVRFRLPNGQIIPFKFGYNTFEQNGYDSVTNIPLQLGWEGKIGQYTIQAAGGVDVFDRLPTALNFNAKVERPIFINLDEDNKMESGLFLSAIVDHGSYKFNAQTLENQITSWRLGPNVYWQIDRNTSFFSLYRFGSYNDGNQEHQSFSRLERKIGQFFVAANVFTWIYTENRQETSGYFSPPDFLVYNAEVGWEGDIFDFLRCRVSGNYGQQRLEGSLDNAFSYQGRCTAKVASNVELDFGYANSNVRNSSTGDSAYNNQTFSGQLRVKF